jgi:hypothetical protein
MTPAQLRCFDELLAIGGARPTTPPGLVDHLREIIEEGTRPAIEAWTERSLWFGKAQLSAIQKCEGNVVANRLETRERRVTPQIATGQITHRAIQLSHTHGGRNVDEYVRLALAGCMSEETFVEFWENCEIQTQSDCLVAAASRVCSFLDTFPALDASWTPRFEESIQAKVGRLTLAARPDLVLGRPRADGRQTMFLCDFKSGELREDHELEARYYALVSTLRNGCAPYRSTVLSLASGEWTEPDVRGEDLVALAHAVVDGVVRQVQVLTEQRDPVLQAGMHCSWCPARATCQANAAWKEAGSPAVFAPLGAPQVERSREAEVGSVEAEQPTKTVLAPAKKSRTSVVLDDDPFAI